MVRTGGSTSRPESWFERKVVWAKIKRKEVGTMLRGRKKRRVEEESRFAMDEFLRYNPVTSF